MNVCHAVIIYVGRPQATNRDSWVVRCQWRNSLSVAARDGFVADTSPCPASS